jgi:hypothetical protein
MEGLFGYGMARREGGREGGRGAMEDDGKGGEERVREWEGLDGGIGERKGRGEQRIGRRRTANRTSSFPAHFDSP